MTEFRERVQFSLGYLTLSKYHYITALDKMFFFTPVKDGSYHVVPSLRPSVCLSDLLSVRPSVNFSCPLHNSDTVQDIFMKHGTNINHYQTMCREQEPTLHLHFVQNYGPLKFF